MSKDNCKLRFKGVENFLRRIAFNLGNTPSETEVKVISCIPIDVTDLQQKITQLEKQLEAVNRNANSSTSQKGASVVNTAIIDLACNNIFSEAASSVSRPISCRQSKNTTEKPIDSTQQKSTISIIFPSGPSQEVNFFADVSEMSYPKKRKQMELKKNFFTRRKIPKKKKFKTQWVYYAQTDNITPFNNYGNGTSKNNNEESNIFDRSYLKNVVRKQYKPSPVNVDFNASEFSSPICRDAIRSLKVAPQPQPYESDMCSCCHGPFQNIDNHMNKNNNFESYSSHTDSRNTYYDSNLYDVIPVKENATKVKNIEFPKRKNFKNQKDVACFPGYMRPRYKNPPYIVNYNTTVPTRQNIRKVPIKPHAKEKVLKKMYRQPILSAPVNGVHTKVPKSRSIEFSEVYTKRLENSRRKNSKSTPPKVSRNDAACLTVANTECQTSTSTNATSQENKNEEVVNVPTSEDITKVTLNQIKDILQSVLTEVKTNSKIGPANTITGLTKKKDAVVQNGISQSNMYGGSSLLQTFTYSPYDMDPYGPSCSQQMQNNPCYPNMTLSPMKCMQHYPLFVQPGRNMCASCYRNNPQINKMPNMKRAASTATNTEELLARSKETENLIKEIYKAMALNVDVPTQDTPMKQHGDLNQSIYNYNTRTEDVEANHIAKAISEIFKNTNPIDTSVTQNTETPFESKLTSNETSFRSKPERNYAQSTRREAADYTNETEQVSQQLESDEESDVTIVNEETESASSQTESECDDEDVILAVEEPSMKKEKKGFLSKMLKIFMPRSRNRRKSKARNDQSSDNDSVNYQTIIHKTKPTLKPIISQSRAVVYYSKKPQKLRNQRTDSPRKLPTPYMEQEYRRYFDEKLTFHDNHAPRSGARETIRERPVYYQKIEARSALVDYNEEKQNSPRMETKSVKQYTTRGNQKQKSYSLSISPERVLPKAMSWLEKHKIGIHCGKEWKKLILES